MFDLVLVYDICVSLILSCFFEFVLGDDQLLLISLRRLGLLLIPTKTKVITGDIPFLLRIVPVSILTIYVIYIFSCLFYTE